MRRWRLRWGAGHSWGSADDATEATKLRRRDGDENSVVSCVDGCYVLRWGGPRDIEEVGRVAAGTAAEVAAAAVEEDQGIGYTDG